MKNKVFHSENKQGLFQEVFYAGLKDAVRTSLGIFKIMIPVSLLMAILNYLGVIDYLSIFLQPVTNLLGLSGKSILVLLSGYLINTYSAIALMISLGLTLKEISILSSMILLSHTLPIELSIQRKAGGKMWLLLLTRVGSSILTGIILGLLLPGGNEIASFGAQSVSSAETASLMEALKEWLVGNVTIIKIFIINIFISMAFRFLIKYHMIDKLGNLLKHVMFLFGLAKEAAPYWLVANVIGLIYGAGILITANENNSLEKNEISKLNLSICSMHSMIQETANFLPLGVNISILILPRFITAVLSVWVYKFVTGAGRRIGIIVTDGDFIEDKALKE